MGQTTHTQARASERLFYDRDTQLTRTDLWAWTDAVRRVESPAGAGGARAQQDLLKAMCDPQLYGEGRGTAVEMRETHAAWTFLVGESAFRLKKPVVLPFLDYGNLDARRLMCRREITLNRPLAGDIYRDVRAVVRRGGRFQLVDDGAADAVAHVVEMRRYDETRTLAATLASGRITASELAAVARRVADVHAAAPARRHDPEILTRLKHAIDGDLELLLAHDQLFEPARVLAAQRFADAFLAGHAALLLERARCGNVRECHGDLRAVHVLLGEEIRIVDCVEFDDELREIDVAADLAFLAMDLAAHERTDLCQLLLDRYRMAGGDPGPDALVWFYAATKAWTRAKLSALLASDAHAAPGARRAAADEAGELFALGERLSWQARLPLALIVCGPQDCGKSALAGEIATRSGLPVVAPGEAGTEGVDADRTYRELGTRAGEQIAKRGGVVVDATFGRRDMREAFAEAFGEKRPALFCECCAPVDVLEGRARTRPGGDPHAAERFDPLESDIEPAHHLILRTDQSLAELYGDLVAMLDRHLARADVASTTTEVPA
ncbi:MAG: hypothetical protein ABSC56_05495 [Solirubrobacteraceae bacterium]|jgi:aminoglycoside phosphotransferase family enzyme/predicted kinase